MGIAKKITAWALCLVLAMGLLPAASLTAHAAGGAGAAITRVDIEGITSPVVGETPVNDAAVSTPGVSVGENTFWVRYAGGKIKDRYDDNTRVSSTPFRGGESYMLQIMLEAEKFDPGVEVYYKGAKLPAPDPSNMNQSSATYATDGLVVAYIATGEPAAAYTVTFDSTGGSAVVAQTVEEGQNATKPADPVKEGFDFAGWTFEGKAWDFENNTVTGDITLVAEWKEKDADGNDGGGEPGIPEGDDPSDEQPDAGEPKKPEPNDGESDAEGALAKTGDDVPFAGLFATVAAAGIAVLALRRRVA